MITPRLNAASVLGRLCSFILLVLLFPPHHSLLDDVDVDVEDVQKDEDDAEGGREAALVAGVLVQGSLAVEAGGGVQVAGGEVGAGAGLRHQQEGEGRRPEGVARDDQALEEQDDRGVRLGQGGGWERGRSGLAGNDRCKSTHACRSWRLEDLTGWGLKLDCASEVD